MKYQVGFKHFFYLRLLRSAYVTFLKTGCKYQNVMTSGIYRTHYIYEIIHPDTCQSQITLPISIWDTLYIWYQFQLEWIKNNSNLTWSYRVDLILIFEQKQILTHCAGRLRDLKTLMKTSFYLRPSSRPPPRPPSRSRPPPYPRSRPPSRPPNPPPPPRRSRPPP